MSDPQMIHASIPRRALAESVLGLTGADFEFDVTHARNGTNRFEVWADGALRFVAHEFRDGLRTFHTEVEGNVEFLAARWPDGGERFDVRTDGRWVPAELFGGAVRDGGVR